MTTYQSMFLCLMVLFIVILLTGILLLLITHVKENKSFRYNTNDSIDDIKFTVRNVYNNVDNISAFISKLQDNIHAMCERIVSDQAKQIEPENAWIAEPCPVCGSNPVITANADGCDAMVFCRNCNKFGYTGGGETRRGAVYAWNRAVTDYVVKANAEKEIEE